MTKQFVKIVALGLIFFAMSNAAESMYSKKFIDLIEIVYGPGFLSQGGPQAVDHMFKNISLDDKKVLDIGSGLGGVDFYLAQKYNTAITALEIEPFLIKEAEQRLEKCKSSLSGSVTFVWEDTYDYLKQFEDNSFDIIFSRETILHIPVEDKIKYFSQVHRILKNGGIIVIMDWMHSSKNYSQTLQDMIESDGIPYNLITTKEYHAVLSSAGFKDIDFTNITSQTVNHCQENCQLIIKEKEMITQKFDPETYKETLQSWTNQLFSFQNNELVAGIFKATK